MKVSFGVVALAFYCAVICSCVEAQEVEVSPLKGHGFLLKAEGSTAIVKEVGKLEKVIEFYAENKINIEINDYNFDGVKDFSVWHMDDGMGVYKMYRVFVFDIKTEDFLEIFPDCGDEFVNLKADKVSRSLISTYFYEGEPKSCISSIGRVK